MFRRITFCFVLVLGFLMSGAIAQAQESSNQPEMKVDVASQGEMKEGMAEAPVKLPANVVDVRYKVCPIMGGETKPEFAAIFQSKIYHFCCPGCIETFNKDPKAAIEKIKDSKEVALSITNKDGKCPITGQAANGAVFLVREDKVTFYCCAACIGKDKL